MENQTRFFRIIISIISLHRTIDQNDIYFQSLILKSFKSLLVGAFTRHYRFCGPLPISNKTKIKILELSSCLIFYKPVHQLLPMCISSPKLDSPNIQFLDICIYLLQFDGQPIGNRIHKLSDIIRSSSPKNLSPVKQTDVCL